jgi:hypothetical protein
MAWIFMAFDQLKNTVSGSFRGVEAGDRHPDHQQPSG